MSRDDNWDNWEDTPPMKTLPKQKSSSVMALSPSKSSSTSVESSSTSMTSLSGRGSTPAGGTATNSNNSAKGTPNSSSNTGSSKVSKIVTYDGYHVLYVIREHL